MADDQRRGALRHYVAEMLAVEGDIEAALDQLPAVVGAHPEAAAAVGRFHATARDQREALRAALAGLGGEVRPATSAVATLFGAADAAGPGPVSAALRAAYTAFNHAAGGYAVLCELAFRLYDPPLRELAPRHLRAYAEAAQALNQLLPTVVAWELQQGGLECACVCPMCSLGACGCVAVGTEAVNAAWRETAPAGEAAPGFPVQPPRDGSPLARAGVRGGERILAVDGREVRSFRDVQAAIREHQLGEEVRLLVQRGAAAPREVRAEHVGDYPRP